MTADSIERETYDVVFVVEATAALGPYFQDLRQAYIEPTLEKFSGGPPEDVDYGFDYSCTLYNLVTYFASDCMPGPTFKCVAPTSNTFEFLKWLDRTPFVGGAGEGRSHIAEGLSAALQVFDDLTALRENSVTTKKFCILISNSPPYDIQSQGSLNYADHTADALCSMIGERGINFCLMAPRKLPALHRLFVRANGDNQVLKDYTKDPRHLVLLKGYQLQERAPSPVSEKKEIEKNPLLSKAIGSPAQGLVNSSPKPGNQGLPKRVNSPAASATDGQFKVPTSTMSSQAANPVSVSNTVRPGMQMGIRQSGPRQAAPTGMMNQGIRMNQVPPAAQEAAKMVLEEASKATPMTQNASPTPAGINITANRQVRANLTTMSSQVQANQQNPNMMMQNQMPRAQMAGPQGMMMGGPRMNQMNQQLTPQQLNQLQMNQHQMGQQQINQQPQMGQQQINQQPQMGQQQMGQQQMGQQQMGQQQIGQQQIGQQQIGQSQMGQQQMNQGLSQNQPQQQQQIAPNQAAAGQQQRPRPIKMIWRGVLEWQDKKQAATPAVRQSKSLQCEVFALATGEDIDTSRWRTNLIMQLIPQQLLSQLQVLIKNSRNVEFKFPQNDRDTLQNLQRVMSSGFAGCVHFPVQSQCDIRVLLLLYSSKKDQFIGMIPNDQARFVEGIRTVITNHKNAQQQKQMNMQQQGMSQAQSMPQTSQSLPQGQVTQGMQPVHAQGAQGQQAAQGQPLDDERRTNMQKMQALQQEMEALKQKELQFQADQQKSQQMKVMEQQARQQQLLQLQQQQRMLHQQAQQQQQQQQQQQDQPAPQLAGPQNNQQLRHLLLNQQQQQQQHQQQNQFRQQQFLMQQQRQRAAGQMMPQQMHQQMAGHQQIPQQMQMQQGNQQFMQDDFGLDGVM